ncbi:MAG: ADP-glyceromanno-heptose 6-epimerase [Nitrospinaceae bacterium]|nr:ADP-glyceromanno-heptose 6-epimerase [Nitrospinaceae bacterium]NIR57182.1 ADP-glyceromanno-heptose 6-epimerase [Nitrospinaceae bacterium]NIS87624.1 ADP-glyceromanno-heptose 6-epimerase [Nitrospinaceae bacterium]NIT85173.1 ADP-glyceromanno-heptose 6-epimerase [Nitrospinaceae bacterium]NIU46681.1 ADP-glyceromanno-heptose 6-epimerase [Nitrospinaceae bacterium]
MIGVTGGAGFIGSAIVHELNRRGITDILVVDNPEHEEQKKNLAPLKFKDRVSKEDFLNQVKNRTAPTLDALIHMGACTDTTCNDEKYLVENNLEYSRALATWALEQEIRFIYASSAGTYGEGTQGFFDAEDELKTLCPLNGYAESKHQFDLWALNKGYLRKIVGLKYFNVYGPNEAHKGDMQSLVGKGYRQIRDTGKIRLFKSYNSAYPDGGQERDFLYIKDAVGMTLFFLDHPNQAGLYNVGSGVARTWNDLAQALFASMGKEPDIEYIEMPKLIQRQYQYHTQAEMEKLRSTGYNTPPTPLEVGVRDYVQNYLIPGKHLGE